MSQIDEIKARVDIVELVSETVKLRRSGKNYTGFCPFHSNTRTPAFVVFPESGTWRCFGQCNEGGDIFGYVMKRESWEFGEALKYLAEKAGVQLKPVTPQDTAEAEEHDSLRQILEDAATFYRHNLLNTPPGKIALDYLHRRGLKDDTIEAFGLGYAPNAWEETYRYFKSKGSSEKDLLIAGLLNEREADGQEGRSRIFDRFRHRIMFPIRDERGRMAGFGARILDPNDIPKFLNSPQTPIFDKGRLLYGLDRARKPIRAADQVVIVEGYLDVIALHQAGFANAVSPMGTALTEHQLYLLKRFTRRIVLALDPDAAGDKATLRGLQIARQAMDHTDDLVFDARGLLGHEARLQADIRVTTLPPGMDPDEVVNRDPAEWTRILENAKPIVVHVMETLAAGRDLDDPKVKTEIAAQVLPLIQDVPSEIERDTYRQRLARLLQVNERTLEAGSPARPAPRRRRDYPSEGAARPRRDAAGAAMQLRTESRSSLEGYCLGILLRRPDLLYRVDRKMQENGLARITMDDFQRADHQIVFGLIHESVDQDESEPLNYVMNRLSLPMMEMADEMLARTEKLDPNEQRVLEHLVQTLLGLRRRSLDQNLEHLHFLQREAQEQGDLMAVEYLKAAQQALQMRQLLDNAAKQITGRTTPSQKSRMSA